MGCLFSKRKTEVVIEEIPLIKKTKENNFRMVDSYNEIVCGWRYRDLESLVNFL